MEREILIDCVLAPMLLASVGIVAAYAATRWGAAWSQHPRTRALSAVVFWCAAVALALAARQNPGVWPDEAWQQVLWPILISSLALASIGDRPKQRDWRWLFAAVGAAATAMVVMPHGDGWADRMELHRPWAFAVTSSSFVNLWMLDAMARRGAQRWVLWVSVAGLAGPTMLAASAYGGLAEWLLSAIVATTVMAIAATFLPAYEFHRVLYPATLFASAATASGRFFTYEDHPIWLYVLILAIPTLIAGVDVPIRRRSAAVRWVIAAVTAIMLLGLIGWFALAPTEADAW